MLTALVVICIYTSFGTHKRNYLTIFQDHIKQNCEISLSKRNSIKKIQSLISQIPSSKTLLSTGGIIPHVLRPGIKIYYKGGFSKKLEEYDFVLIGRKENSHPLDINDIEKSWKCFIEKAPYSIIFKDDFHLLLQSPFPKQCISSKNI